MTINICYLLQLYGCLDDKSTGREMDRMKAEACVHAQLKIVEIVEFPDTAFRFVKYLVKSCVSLEKMIIDPCCSRGLPWESAFGKETSRARKKAKQVHSIVKSGTILEIL